jgi:hypothetical protein
MRGHNPAMAHVQSYQKPLKPIFTDEDQDLAPRIARVCIQFEDLRVEYWSAVDSPAIADLLQNITLVYGEATPIAQRVHDDGCRPGAPCTPAALEDAARTVAAYIDALW